MLIKEHDILKKPYLIPRISFEEIEEDEREMLMVSKSSTEGGDPGGSEAGNGEIGNSLDFSFEETTTGQSSTSLSDFLINDEY